MQTTHINLIHPTEEEFNSSIAEGCTYITMNRRANCTTYLHHAFDASVKEGQKTLLIVATLQKLAEAARGCENCKQIVTVSRVDADLYKDAVVFVDDYEYSFGGKGELERDILRNAKQVVFATTK